MDDIALLNRLLTVIEQDILPKTRVGIAHRNKIFGAAILRKSDLSLIVAETNNEVENPLWHGEMHAIKRLYELSNPMELISPKDCIFLATHEPCSLCLSAITWGGYDNFNYLFSHENSRDKFNIPHDIRILREVFGDTDGIRPLYNRTNAFWHSYSIAAMVDRLDVRDADREALQAHI
jgi:tRNA(Arg) A34 adenosine deaminase TadA